MKERSSVGLALLDGVVSLAEQDGHELGSGLEVGAGLTRGFDRALELDHTTCPDNPGPEWPAAAIRPGGSRITTVECREPREFRTLGGANDLGY